MIWLNSQKYMQHHFQGLPHNQIGICDTTASRRGILFGVALKHRENESNGILLQSDWDV